MHIPPAVELCDPGRTFRVVLRHHAAVELGGVQFGADGSAEIAGSGQLRRIVNCGEAIESCTEVPKATPAASVDPVDPVAPVGGNAAPAIAPMQSRADEPEVASSTVLDLSAYAGKQVVLVEDRVVYVADDFAEAAGYVRERGLIETATIHKVVD